MCWHQASTFLASRRVGLLGHGLRVLRQALLRVASQSLGRSAHRRRVCALFARATRSTTPNTLALWNRWRHETYKDDREAEKVYLDELPAAPAATVPAYAPALCCKYGRLYQVDSIFTLLAHMALLKPIPKYHIENTSIHGAFFEDSGLLSTEWGQQGPLCTTEWGPLAPFSAHCPLSGGRKTHTVPLSEGERSTLSGE